MLDPLQPSRFENLPFVISAWDSRRREDLSSVGSHNELAARRDLNVLRDCLSAEDLLLAAHPTVGKAENERDMTDPSPKPSIHDSSFSSLSKKLTLP